MAMTWVKTNYRERHLKEGSKVLGKVQFVPGEELWDAIVNSRPRTYLGSYADEFLAKHLVTKAVLKEQQCSKYSLSPS